MMGAQASKIQKDKIEGYLKLGKEEGAEVLTGGEANHIEGLEGGYYIKPTIFKGNNRMRIFQEEIFGPVLAFTTFKDEAEALEIANDTIYGLEPAFGLEMRISCIRFLVTCKRVEFGSISITPILLALLLEVTSNQALEEKITK